MEMQKIYVNIIKSGDNYGCSWHDNTAGTVVVTSDTIESLKEKFDESLKLHIDGCIADGDELPPYLVSNDYEIEFEY